MDDKKLALRLDFVSTSFGVKVRMQKRLHTPTLLSFFVNYFVLTKHLMGSTPVRVALNAS
jgi:hypothetical protein